MELDVFRLEAGAILLTLFSFIPLLLMLFAVRRLTKLLLIPFRDWLSCLRLNKKILVVFGGIERFTLLLKDVLEIDDPLAEIAELFCQLL